MAIEETAKPNRGKKLVIRNIGLLLSGALEQPILDADAIVAIDGVIHAIGKEKLLDADGASSVIDANGSALVPGLIDSHVPPGAGERTPWQNQLFWLDKCPHGGVNTVLWASE